MSQDTEFSLERFERLTYTRQHEAAARQVINLVSYLDRTYGQIGNIGSSSSEDFPADLRDAHLATRIASALTALFSDPDLKLSPLGFKQLILFQRWLATLFGASPFANADHVIHVMNVNAETNPEQITLNDADFLKYCLLYSLDSSIPLQPDVLWAKDKGLAGSLFVALLSARITASPEAHAKREELLGWFPSRVKELSLDDIPEAILHNVWMHCSYGERPDKHEIKRAFNELIRDRLLDEGFEDIPTEAPPLRDKPVVMVVAEWFNSRHSVYRTHSASIKALREKFHVVGISLQAQSDETARAIFDEIHLVPAGQPVMDSVRTVTDLAASIQPDIIYYLSVGMFRDTIFLCNLRLAPIQMATWGHSASTFSPFVDYYLVEEDLFGDPVVFSEKVVALPKDALPYQAPSGLPKIKPVIRETPDPLRVAVAASVMKLNPVFLNTLLRIANESKSNIEYHFLTGFGRGIGKVHVQNLVRRFLPDCAVVYPELEYAAYLERINSCDMFLNPFPFGNCNGVVDTVRQGLVGVCWSGPEIHSHIDEGLFGRLGLPAWLVTRSPDEYVKAAIKLADNHKLRVQLSRVLLKKHPDQILARGDASLFVKTVEWIMANHAKFSASDQKLLVPPLNQKPKARKTATAET